MMGVMSVMGRFGLLGLSLLCCAACGGDTKKNRSFLTEPRFWVSRVAALSDRPAVEAEGWIVFEDEHPDGRTDGVFPVVEVSWEFDLVAREATITRFNEIPGVDQNADPFAVDPFDIQVEAGPFQAPVNGVRSASFRPGFEFTLLGPVNSGCKSEVLYACDPLRSGYGVPPKPPTGPDEVLLFMPYQFAAGERSDPILVDCSSGCCEAHRFPIVANAEALAMGSVVPAQAVDVLQNSLGVGWGYLSFVALELAELCGVSNIPDIPPRRDFSDRPLFDACDHYNVLVKGSDYCSCEGITETSERPFLACGF